MPLIRKLDKKAVTLFLHLGRPHNALVQECNCTPCYVDVMIGKRFWPSSTDQPSIGFHFELLNLLVPLYLDGAVAVKTFIKALFSKNGECSFVQVKLTELWPYAFSN